jgi:hypothetical protein
MSSAITKPGGFEAHMTFPKEAYQHVDTLGTVHGWTFSQITGCPMLGQGTYCYLTGYSKDDPGLLRRIMEQITADAFLLGIEPLRCKIEHIVYDSKTGVNEIGA